MPAAIRIYLDACALSRLTDNANQARIAAEAEAVVHIFQFIQFGTLLWIASSALEVELRRDPDPRRRADALAMLHYAKEFYIPDSQAIARAKSLHQLGYGALDALHLASAEFSKSSILLTTDDRFLNQIRRRLGNPLVRAENPLNYLHEVKP